MNVAGPAVPGGVEEVAPILIVVALREEARALERSLQRRRPGRLGSLKYQDAWIEDIPITLLRTGIGLQLAGERTGHILEQGRHRGVLGLGFCGGLTDAMSCGDILIAKRVTAAQQAAESSPPPASREFHAAASLVAAAEEALGSSSVPGKLGHLLTVDKVLKSASEKRAAGADHRTDAVDMESAAVMEAAAAASIPALCTRVVLDEVGCELPFDFGKILSAEGSVRPVNAVRELVTKPGGVLRLPHLRRLAQMAAASLAEWFPHLVRAVHRHLGS